MEMNISPPEITCSKLFILIELLYPKTIEIPATIIEPLQTTWELWGDYVQIILVSHSFLFQ